MVIFNVYIIYIICLLYVFLLSMGSEIHNIVNFFFFFVVWFLWEESNCLLSEYLSVCSAGTISHRKVSYEKRSVILHVGL